MKTLFAVVAALALMLSAAGVYAETIQGKVSSVNTTNSTITISVIDAVTKKTVAKVVFGTPTTKLTGVQSIKLFKVGDTVSADGQHNAKVNAFEAAAITLVTPAPIKR